MAEQTINWHGKADKAYYYWILPIGSSMKPEPGNYVFARETEPGRFAPLYIGQTGNLKERLTDDHEKMPCIRERGATHIHTHASSEIKGDRLSEESDLIERLNPPCNGQTS